MFTPLLLAALVGIPHAAPADGAAVRWGQVGHRIIARVVAARLSPDAAREVKRLLDGASLAEIASWADDVRRDRPATGPWHYVNIPVTETRYDAAKYCKDGDCVVGALERQIALLGDRTRPKAERAEALKWVVHLVGDLHQPLHAGDRGDRGGNDVRLTYDAKQGNLHALWDTGLLLATGDDEETYVRRITGILARRGDLRTVAAGTPVDWAMESHDVARDVVYPFLPQSLELDGRYLGLVRPAMDDRLLRAAVRLGAVLERTLGR